MPIHAGAPSETAASNSAPSRAGRIVHVILNPHAGAKKAPDFWSHTVQPLLEECGVPYEIFQTEAPRDGERIGRLLRARVDALSCDGGLASEESLACAVLGGDGTSQELIDGFLSPSSPSSAHPPPLELVLIPQGTANALYNSLYPPSTTPTRPSFLSTSSSTTDEDAQILQSLFAFLVAQRAEHQESTPASLAEPGPSSSASSATSASLRRLTLSHTILQTAKDEETVSFLSHIVTSTAMHASLLHLSEAYREEHPGIERFKLAAAQVIGTRFNASCRLLGDAISRWSPSTESFEPLVNGSPDLLLQGPFAYALSSTTVARLEPTFVISPLLDDRRPSEGHKTMDLIILRPERSRSVTDVQTWEDNVKGALGRAYRDGEHIRTLLDDPVDPSVGGVGEVEVYRCSGWEWRPSNTPSLTGEKGDRGDDLSQLVCADGAIHRIPEGGCALCLVRDVDDGGVWVWT